MAKLGLIGLGNLGRALGEQLSKASLVVFDRHAAKTLENAVTVASVADVVARSTTVVSCVPDDAAATAVADEVLSAAKPGLLHVSVSTLSPVCATDLERKHQEAGVGFVAAPVFARPENMRAGQASFALSGGDAALRQRAIDEALSHAAPVERCFDFGDDAGRAAAAKLTGNFMIAGAIEALAEGLDLAEGHGLDRQQVLRMLTSTIFDCAIYRGYGDRIARRDHSEGGFSMANGLKDARLIRDAAAATRTAMPLGAHLAASFEIAAMDPNISHLDWSALALHVAGLADAPPTAAPPGTRWDGHPSSSATSRR